jgi:hypothetical protein
MISMMFSYKTIGNDFLWILHKFMKLKGDEGVLSINNIWS